MNWLGYVKYVVLGCALVGIIHFVSCSGVDFQTVALSHCEGLEGLPGTYECTPDGDITHVKQNLSLGAVDILFVVDNSKSMYEEQEQMAERFENLLGVIEDLEYQIAITTTDIYKDRGKLLRFPNGDNILSWRTEGILSQFKNTIQRKETLICEQSGDRDSCPSNDERGIYAANLVVENRNANFFRPEAHLAFVILSDEDVRSKGGDGFGRKLESKDLPETLVSNVVNKLGAQKIMSAHAIVVEDRSCKSKQRKTNKDSDPQVGEVYIDLAERKGLSEYTNIAEGSVGSICADDYAEQMGDIGDVVRSHTYKVQLACEPLEDTLLVYFGLDLIAEGDYKRNDENQLSFDDELPSGSKITLKYDCNRF